MAAHFADVWVGDFSLSCHRLQAGHAEYVNRWDDKRALARHCAAAGS